MDPSSRAYTPYSSMVAHRSKIGLASSSAPPAEEARSRIRTNQYRRFERALTSQTPLSSSSGYYASRSTLRLAEPRRKSRQGRPSSQSPSQQSPVGMSRLGTSSVAASVRVEGGAREEEKAARKAAAAEEAARRAALVTPGTQMERAMERNRALRESMGLTSSTAESAEAGARKHDAARGGKPEGGASATPPRLPPLRGLWDDESDGSEPPTPTPGRPEGVDALALDAAQFCGDGARRDFFDLCGTVDANENDVAGAPLSARTAYAKACKRGNLAPLPVVIAKEGGSSEVVNLNSYGLGDKLVEAYGEGLTKMLQQNLQLRELHLADNLLTPPGVIAIMDAVQAAESLTLLDLSGNAIGFEGAQAIANCLSQHSGIREVTLANTKMGDSAARVLLKGLRDQPSLQRLDLTRCSMGHGGGAGRDNAKLAATAPAPLWTLTKSAKGHAYYFHVGSREVRWKAPEDLGEEREREVPRPSWLQTYDKLSWEEPVPPPPPFDAPGGPDDKVSKEKKKEKAEPGEKKGAGKVERKPTGATGALCELLQGGKCPLQNLNLAWNAIGEVQCLWISNALRSNHHLVSLQLSWCNVGDAGGMYLADALRSGGTIKTLDLGYSGIKEKGTMVIADMLKENKTLETVVLNGNALGQGGGRAILRAIRKIIQFGWKRKIEIADCILDTDGVLVDDLFFDRASSASYSKHNRMKVEEGTRYCVHAGAVCPLHPPGSGRGASEDETESTCSCMRHPADGPLDIAVPEGHWTCDLATPFGRTIAWSLVELAWDADGENWDSETLNGDPFDLKEPDDGDYWTRDDYQLPQDGILELTYKVTLKVPRYRDVIELGMMRALVAMMTDPAVKDCGLNIVRLACHEYFFSAEYAGVLISLMKDSAYRVAAAHELLPRVVDFLNVNGQIFEYFEEDEIAALEQKMGPELFNFVPCNPTGHFKLNLMNPQHLTIMKLLMCIASEQKAYRKANDLIDTSQRGDWDNWRNETMSGRKYDIDEKKISSGNLEHGTLEFDYVSTDVRHRIAGADPMPEETFDYFVEDLRLARDSIVAKTVEHKENHKHKKKHAESLKKKKRAEEMARVKEIFNAVDTDGSGVLDKNEVRHIFMQMGKTDLLEDAAFEAAFKEMDKGGGGDVNISEFFSWFEKQPQKLSKADILGDMDAETQAAVMMQCTFRGHRVRHAIMTKESARVDTAARHRRLAHLTKAHLMIEEFRNEQDKMPEDVDASSHYMDILDKKRKGHKPQGRPCWFVPRFSRPLTVDTEEERERAVLKRQLRMLRRSTLEYLFSADQVTRLLHVIPAGVGYTKARDHAVRLKAKSNEVRLTSIFQQADSGDGKLDELEVRKIFHLLRLPHLYADTRHARKNFDKAFREMDEDETGEVSLEEFKDWWNLQPHVVTQAEVLDPLGNEEKQQVLKGHIDAIVVLFSRITDLEDVDIPMLLGHDGFGGEDGLVTVEDLGGHRDGRALAHLPYLQLQKRLGAVNMFNPIKPEQEYVLDLTQPEQNTACAMLVELLEEPGENMERTTFNGRPADVPATWRDKIDPIGLFCCAYKTPKHCASLPIRLGLARKLLMPGRDRWRKINEHYINPDDDGVELDSHVEDPKDWVFDGDGSLVTFELWKEYEELGDAWETAENHIHDAHKKVVNKKSGWHKLKTAKKQGKLIDFPQELLKASVLTMLFVSKLRQQGKL